MELYKVERADGGEPMMLRLSEERAAAYREDPAVSKMTAAKAADEKAAIASSGGGRRGVEKSARVTLALRLRTGHLTPCPVQTRPCRPGGVRTRSLPSGNANAPGTAGSAAV